MESKINSTFLEELRAQLKANADDKIKESEKRIFKEEISSYGIRVFTVERIAKEFYKTKIKSLPKQEVFASCEELWKSGYIEESFVACSWAYACREQFESTDFETFSRWVNSYVNNWASCDTLCNHTVGTFIEMFPSYVKELKAWAKSTSRWARRAAAVTLIIPARHGLFLSDIFDIATTLLEDKDDLVQKGYGWMLKAASEVHQKEVFDFVIKNKAIMPRTALRYAIEKMPKELKAEAMKK